MTARRKNLFGWLTKKQVTYRRDVGKERREIKRQALEERKERIALKRLEAQERAADAKIAAAERKIETAGKKTDTGGMTEAKFEAIKARLEKEIEAQEQFKAAARARAGNPCARTRKTHVSDRAKRYRANQPGCQPKGVKKCKLCGSRSDVMVDHIDGNESNGRKSNLRWLCRSCNTLRGAAMARSGEGRRTVQYNPQGAQTLGEYVLAVLQHTRGAHDEAGRLIHATPKWKRQEYASEIWAARKSRGNPAVSAQQYRLAQAVLSGTARDSHMSVEAAREIVDRTPARLRSKFMKANPTEPTRTYRGATIEHLGDFKGYRVTIPAQISRDRRTVTVEVYTLPQAKERIDAEFGPRRNPSETEQTSTEYRLGYNLGQTDRQTASLAKTWQELEATFDSMFSNGTRASALPFFEGYKAGYDPTGGTPERNPRGQASRGSSRNRRNPEIDAQDDGSEEYQQALRTAELFHGRPVKEQIEVEESIRTHDWYVSIGPLIKLVIKPVTKKPKKRVPLPFHQTESGQVQLFTSPDGKQFYLRGGDQELDLEAFGMGPKSAWFRDHMLIGEAVEITYQDKKKFHSFKLTDYYHKLGEVTRVKPTLVYNSLSKKLGIIGGQYRIEMEDLVDGMSPGIVN